MKELIVNNTTLTYVDEFKAVSRPTTYTDIVSCPSAKLRPFVAKYGQDALEQIISSVITGIAEGLGLQVNGDQILDASALIIQEYPDTKLSDFKLFKNQVLMGRIGSQIDGQLWKWNTRTILTAWAEYYALREDVFCDYREQKHNQAKQEYTNGFAKALANATPEQLEKHREYVAKLEAATKAKQIKAEEAKAIIPAKLTLEQIAAHEGIDILKLSEAIKAKAERRRVEENLTIPMMLILQAEMASTLYEARQDGSYLHKLIESNQTKLK